MAARKKAKSKSQRKKAPARKPAARKKAIPVKKKKAALRKAPARRAAPKKKLAARLAAPKKKVAAPAVPVQKPAPARKPAPATPIPPSRPAAPSAPPAPLANEERVGTVTHYYSHLSVAVVRLDSGALRVGDMIHVTGHTTDFRQPVESLQIEHQPVPEVGAGQEFGLKVVDHAREHDAVYKVKA